VEAVKQILLSRMRRFISSKPHAAHPAGCVWNERSAESRTQFQDADGEQNLRRLWGRVVERKGGWNGNAGQRRKSRSLPGNAADGWRRRWSHSSLFHRRLPQQVRAIRASRVRAEIVGFGKKEKGRIPDDDCIVSPKRTPAADYPAESDL